MMIWRCPNFKKPNLNPDRSEFWVNIPRPLYGRRLILRPKYTHFLPFKEHKIET
jgi:hypothetical protein